MLWVAYAVGAAVVEASLDILRKKVVPPPLVTATFASAITATIGAVAIIALRPPLPDPFFLVVVLAAGGVTALIQPLYISAVRLAPLSVVVPYTSLTAVFVLGTGILIAGDRPTAAGVAGVLLVGAGLFFLHADGAPGIRGTLAAARSKGVRRMIAVAALLALLAALDAVAVRAGGILLTLTIESAVAATLLALVLVGQRATPRGATLLQILPIGVLEFALYALVLAALAVAPASYVVAVKRLWPLLTVAAGMLFFEEREGIAPRLAGALVMVAGAVTIALWG
jgi:drug/metabolite transporter (DMT)-like permease